MAQQSGSSQTGGKMSPVDISKLLQGVDFPADKHKLEQWAEQHISRAKEGESALNAIRKLPDRQYQNMADVEKSFGQVRS